jgi:hypothetical protein
VLIEDESILGCGVEEELQLGVVGSLSVTMLDGKESMAERVGKQIPVSTSFLT